MMNIILKLWLKINIRKPKIIRSDFQSLIAAACSLGITKKLPIKHYLILDYLTDNRIAQKFDFFFHTEGRSRVAIIHEYKEINNEN
ncbi:unnamed protein product [Blepharisma stoltei]|uniref:Uncharacterized protein n=1 Tax=Blepharisma stoltei TaxID=1481888 RepID=A0AAU9JGV3_9CILI|nr:unnamed protein product [Blepharisma stoltei]